MVSVFGKGDCLDGSRVSAERLSGGFGVSLARRLQIPNLDFGARRPRAQNEPVGMKLAARDRVLVESANQVGAAVDVGKGP